MSIQVEHSSAYEANLKAALSLIEAGFSVFPCSPNKKPYISGWQKGSDYVTTVRTWWAQWPDAIPAIPCGINQLLVIDCDVKNGIDGNANWERFCLENGLELSCCLAVNTPSGGCHYYFRQTRKPLHRNTAGKLANAIDTRGDGGYVIAPGATLPDGRFYEIVSGSINDPIETPPGFDAYLRELCGEETTRKENRRVHDVKSDLGNERPYALKVLEEEAETVAKAQDGHRNHTLNIAAFNLGTLIPNGGVERHEVEFVLTNAAYSNGLEPKETSGTIKSGIESGMAKPREPVSERQLRVENGVDLSVFKANVAAQTYARRSITGLVKVRVSDVEPEHISWLWKTRIAIGKVTILAGDPGLGKSQLTAYIAARVSTATPFPNDDGSPPIGSVVMFSCEDDIADTIRPRLEAAGADMTRVYVVNERKDDKGGSSCQRRSKNRPFGGVKAGHFENVVLEPSFS